MAYTSNDFWAQHDAMAAAAPTQNQMATASQSIVKQPNPNQGIIAQAKAAPTNDNQKILDIRSKLTGVPQSTLSDFSQGISPASVTQANNQYTNQYNQIAQANNLPTYPTSSAGTTSGTGGVTSNTYGNLNAYPQSSQQAITQQVTPQSTVSGQLDSLLGANSPYLEQAKIAVREQAAGRGLINSSLAAGAGEAAAIRAALPIATQDANAYFTQAQANQNAQNQFGLNQQSSDLNADLARLNTSLNTDSASRLARLNSDLQMQQNNQNFGFQTQLNQQQFGNNRILQNDQFNQNVQLQDNQTENTGKLNNQTYQQGLETSRINALTQNNASYDTAIQNVMGEQGTTTEQKQNAVTSLEAMRGNSNQFISDLHTTAPGWTSDWATFG